MKLIVGITGLLALGLGVWFFPQANLKSQLSENATSSATHSGSHPTLVPVQPAPATAVVENRARLAVAPSATASPEPPTPVSRLFTGNVSGFPRLDETTEKRIVGARALVVENRPEDAASSLEKAWYEDKDNEYLAIELATLQKSVFQNGKRAEAILREMVERKPDSRLMMAAMGDFLVRGKRESEATPFLRKAAAGEDAPPEAHTELGLNLMAQRDPGSASSAFEAALDLRLKEFESLQDKRESTVLAGQKLGEAAIDSGFAHLESGRLEQAKERYQVALKFKGQDDAGVKALGNGLAKASAVPPRGAE